MKMTLISRTLTYRNTASKPVTLDLVTSGSGPDGAAPTGMFTVSPAHVTIPAGSSAPVTVTTSTREGADGTYSGRVTARTGSVEVAATPIGVIKEVESVTLTLDVLDRSGLRPGAEVQLTNIDTGKYENIPVGTTPLQLRAAKGRYDLISEVATGDTEQPTSLSLVTRPELKLDSDATVTLDARKAKLVRAITVDSKTATPRVTRISLETPSISVSLGTDIDGREVYATPTGKVGYRYRYRQDNSLSEPDRAGRIPKGYNLYFVEQGRIPNPTYRVRDAELARVRSVAHADGTIGHQDTTTLDYPFGPDDTVIWPMGYPVAASGERFDFYSAGNGLVWEERARFAAERFEFGSPLELQPGDRRTEHWNRAVFRPKLVFGPALGRLMDAEVWFSSPDEGDHIARDLAEGISGTTTLSRGGVVIGSSDQPSGGLFDVPDGQATYELTSEVTRALAWSQLSTRTASHWTFSTNADGHASALNLRVGAPVDLQNRVARSGGVTVTLTPELVAPSTAVRTASLAISYDDGKSWRKVPVHRDGGGFTAVLPAAGERAQFVSVRGSAVDAAGNEVDQTVIRAFGLR